MNLHDEQLMARYLRATSQDGGKTVDVDMVRDACHRAFAVSPSPRPSEIMNEIRKLKRNRR